MLKSERSNLEKKTKYSDEKGMYLEVTPSGGMHWRMKFRLMAKKIF
jgi:hypothetical protein